MTDQCTRDTREALQVAINVLKPRLARLSQGHPLHRDVELLTALRESLRLDYYDPARQNLISEHDCTYEDGEWWFGHGMPCKHPGLHGAPPALKTALAAAERTYPTMVKGSDPERAMRALITALHAHEPVRPAEPTCLTCGGAVTPCSGDHWHHVAVPSKPHFPSVKETPHD